MGDRRIGARQGVLIAMVAIAGVLTVLLLVYLVAALMKPEWFA